MARSIRSTKSSRFGNPVSASATLVSVMSVSDPGKPRHTPVTRPSPPLRGSASIDTCRLDGVSDVRSRSGRSRPRGARSGRPSPAARLHDGCVKAILQGRCRFPLLRIRAVLSSVATSRPHWSSRSSPTARRSRPARQPRTVLRFRAGPRRPICETDAYGSRASATGKSIGLVM